MQPGPKCSTATGWPGMVYLERAEKVRILLSPWIVLGI